MAGEVLCPKCGTVSPTETRVCPKCGTALSANGDATARGKALKARPSAAQVRRGGAAEQATVPDDTMMESEEEPPRPAPPPKKPAARPGGPVPQAGGAPRRSNAQSRQQALGDSSVMPSSGGRDSLIGRNLQDYIIQEKLGVGGMGVVYKATHQLIGKAVAIKVLRADIVQDPRDMDRLLDEARIISSIKNRGIINIFGAGTLEDGRHYLIMELLEGESLEALMQREGKIGAGDAVVILEQVLAALTAAHEAGVVHRDLKPANVFLVKEGPLYYAKLLDFGLARRQQQNVTRIAGTPDYISPEHARGRPAGPPADLYAFGVLCFHMLTGQLPFIGNTPMEVMEKHVHFPPPVPHEVNKDIPKALSELILKLLAKDPGERPDATQVKADLKAATKAMRNAATMMSLAVIDPVVSTKKDLENEERRAKEMARSAQVADIKRKVTRRWPIVLAAVIGVWLIGVVVYVLMPSPPPPPVVPPVGKRPPKDPSTPKDPTPTPKDPVAVDPTPKDPTPTDPQPTDPTPKDPVAVNPDPTPNPTPTDPPPVEGEDAGEAAPVFEDPDTDLDDFRLGEERRQRRIDERLDEISATMKDNGEIRDMFTAPVTKVRKQCDAARKLRDIRDCEDEVTKLYQRYIKVL
jgi:serine/threonine-protein kinase